MALACWKQPIFEGFAPSRVCLHVQTGGCVTNSGALAPSVSHGLMEAMRFRLTAINEGFHNSGARLDLFFPCASAMLGSDAKVGIQHIRQPFGPGGTRGNHERVRERWVGACLGCRGYRPFRQASLTV